MHGKLPKWRLLLTGRSQIHTPNLCLQRKCLSLIKAGNPKLRYKLSVFIFSTVMAGIGAAHSISLPTHIYPLYENGLRAHRGQSIEQNNRESARLYAEFAQIAERNEFSWFFGEPVLTEEEIAVVTRRNRMICFPCTDLRTVPARSKR